MFAKREKLAEKLSICHDTVDDLEDTVRRLQRVEEHHGNEIKRLTEIKEKMIEFLRTHGCDITKINAAWDSEIPF